MYKAIVIDDEYMIVKGLTNLINWNKLDYDLVGTAYNGTKALQLIEAFQPNVIISDIQLGDISGLELFERVIKTNPNVLFIFISGFDDFSYCQKALANGAVDYLLKPVNLEYLEQVLTKCIAIIENNQILETVDRISLCNPNNSNNAPTDDKLINNIRTFIDMNYSENISIESIANKFYIGQTYFSELFKKEFGINFKKYLTHIRIEKAKLYIMKNVYKISDISVKVGFDDPGYFSQVFKKHTGLTPREYRNKAINKEKA